MLPCDTVKIKLLVAVLSFLLLSFCLKPESLEAESKIGVLWISGFLGKCSWDRPAGRREEEEEAGEGQSGDVN